MKSRFLMYELNLKGSLYENIPENNFKLSTKERQDRYEKTSRKLRRIKPQDLKFGRKK